MKSQPNQISSLPLPGIPAKRGRPPVANPKSNSARQAAFRERKKAKVAKVLTEVVESFEGETDTQVLEWLATGGPKLKEKAWVELGRRNGYKFPLS